jgi:predicted outer membrane protein
MKTRRFWGSLVGSILAFAAGPPKAQTAPPAPPSAVAPATDAQAVTEPSEALVDAFSNILLLNTTSHMAITHATSGKVRDFALRVAKDATAAGSFLKDRVYSAHMQPSQANVVQRLSSLQGRDFDLMYVSVERDALQRLETAYQVILGSSANPSLQEFATKKLPDVKQLIADLGGL